MFQKWYGEGDQIWVYPRQEGIAPPSMGGKLSEALHRILVCAERIVLPSDKPLTGSKQALSDTSN